MNLPINNYKNEIIDTVRNHTFTIVTAETGSGKSTQVPQFLMEQYEQIIVTEPRIMAAKTLARRVAEERGTVIGTEVGYRTGYDKCSFIDNKIIYCTDGLQLIRSIFDGDYNKKNVLIIDEVHEWNLNIETLIAWCKHMKGKWNTKVVIMSATMDEEALAKYFDEKDVAVLHIPGTLYNVSTEKRSEYDLESAIKESVFENKNVLVFVPGKKEIASILSWAEEFSLNATVLPLHGEMDWEDQKKCFEHYHNSKVVVATNVAQTSITIPDIDVVIDTGKARITETIDGVQGLYLRDISKADIFQRKGRAGRTKEGKYILCSNMPIDERPEYTKPEIQRSILDRVVLQLAAIGLDAEELRFFHQPSIENIHAAKEELKLLGALSNGKATELGHRIVKLPLSVPFARMIVEAEKYDVVEPVMIIAAIMEMGGLIGKDGHYSDFTKEKNSDLLAEWDVWNYLSKIGFIDFKELHINKKNFFKIKEHIKKLREVLYGIVEMTNSNNREAIVKSCISGLVSHVYARKFGCFYDSYGNEIQLDRNSSVDSWANSSFVIGIPKTIEFKGRFGFNQTLNLISFATNVDIETLLDIYPEFENYITIETNYSYSAEKDAVEIVKLKCFGGNAIDRIVEYDSNHPKYEELKMKYEEEQERYKSYFYSSYEFNETQRQEYVNFDGDTYIVFYNYNNRPYIRIPNEVIFTSHENECFLDSGTKVYFASENYSLSEQPNVKALRNLCEDYRIRNLRERIKNDYARIKVQSLDDIIKNQHKIGKIMLTKNNGGYGDQPIFTYGCIALKKNTVQFFIIDDEELASSNTLEALQYMVLKEISNRYGDSKFSHQEGKKKKILTDAEKEVKKEFDSLVREMLQDIAIESVNETLEFLDEYYQELMVR